MDCEEETDDLFYKEMAKFDFRKPFNLSISIYHHEFETTTLRREKEIFDLNQGNQNYRNCVMSREINEDGINNTPHNSLSSNLQTNPNTTILQSYSERSAEKKNYISSTSVFSALSKYTEVNKSADLNGNVNDTKIALKHVSKCIIYALKSLKYFVDITKSTGMNSTQTCHAKNKYITEKKSYFTGCFNTVVRDLLSKRHNMNFVKEFIDRTRYIALNEENFKCTYEQVQYMYNELIKWTEFVKNKRAQHILHTPTPTDTSDICTLIDSAPQFNTQACQNAQNYMNCSRNYQEEILEDALYQDTNTCPFSNFSHIHEAGRENIPDNRQTEINNFTIHHPNRSMSRDSGVMSPGIDQCIDLCPDNEYRESMLPNTTTQLPPYEQHGITANVACEVCGARPTLRCNSCPAFFYCSLVCQAYDWSKHKNICGLK